jgi:hypothetical protein
MMYSQIGLTLNNDWAHRVFSSAELEEFELTSEKIVYNAENGVVLNLGLSNNTCIDVVRNWGKAHAGDIEAQNFMLEFFDGFVEYIEDYLIEEGINFTDEQ